MLWQGKYQWFRISCEACSNMSTRFIAHCFYPDSRQVSGMEDPPFFFQFHLLTLWLFGSPDSLCTVILPLFISAVQNSKCRFKRWRTYWPFFLFAVFRLRKVTVLGMSQNGGRDSSKFVTTSCYIYMGTYFLQVKGEIIVSIILCPISAKRFTQVYTGCARLRENDPYVKVYRYNPKHLYPKLNGYGDNGQRSLKLWQLLHTYWLPNTY